MAKKAQTLLISAALLVPTLLTAQNAPKQTLLALSKRDHTLAIVNPSDLKILARVLVGNDPHEVIASTDGRRAYVSNYGFGAYNSLAVVDLVKQKALATVYLGALRGPHGLVFTAGKAWFTAEAAKAIGSYEPTTGTVDWILGTGQNRTHMIWVADDLSRIVTTNVSSGTVSIIEKTEVRMPPPPPNPGGASTYQGPPSRPKAETATDWDQTVVPVGRGAEGFDVSRDGKEIWVANAQDGTISIIDAVAKKVTETLASNTPGANRLKFTPDGQRALVSSLRNGELAVFDVANRKEIKRIVLGRGAAGIVIQPDGARAFVACSPDDNVAVIDLKSLEVVGRIDVGHEPDGLAWAILH
jgi:YVTN family beta-propeller protein